MANEYSTCSSCSAGSAGNFHLKKIVIHRCKRLRKIIHLISLLKFIFDKT